MESREKILNIFSVWKNGMQNKSIKSSRSAQGRLIDNQEGNLKALLTFYQSLYSENQQCSEKDCCDFIQTLSLPRINEAKLTKCKKPISDNKCQKTILQLANNMSPGFDVFSIEFYKTSGLKLKVYL